MTKPRAEVYTLQATPAFEAQLAKRTAAREAAFLLPHLRSGMEVLDAGCGPGSITLGLAEIVAPGLVAGIDIQSAMVEQARAQAAQRSIATARFQTADIYDLPFEDASFDAVFANGVLMHLGEPVRALKELRRVLRPGGVAGVRDADFTTMLVAPITPVLEQWLAIRNRVRQHNGGDPFLARHHRRLLREAGFARTLGGASVEHSGTAQETERSAAFFKANFQGFARTAVTLQWMDQAAVDAMVAEIDAWGQRPDAFFALTWCETLGWADAAR